MFSVGFEYPQLAYHTFHQVHQLAGFMHLSRSSIRVLSLMTLEKLVSLWVFSELNYD